MVCGMSSFDAVSDFYSETLTNCKQKKLYAIYLHVVGSQYQ